MSWCRSSTVMASRRQWSTGTRPRLACCSRRCGPGGCLGATAPSATRCYPCSGIGAGSTTSLTSRPEVRSWPASSYWHCAAACSYPTELVRKVGGFDPGYFLYLEDVDLVRRMAAARPGLRVVQHRIAPGVHQVSASSRGPEGRRIADLEQARSAERYARSQSGVRWRLIGGFMAALGRYRARTTYQ